MKVQKNYRLDTETLRILSILAEEMEANHTTTLEQCIHFTALKLMPNKFIGYRRDNNFIEAVPRDRTTRLN